MVNGSSSTRGTWIEMGELLLLSPFDTSSSTRGTWIEIILFIFGFPRPLVVLHTGDVD